VTDKEIALIETIHILPTGWDTHFVDTIVVHRTANFPMHLRTFVYPMDTHFADTIAIRLSDHFVRHLRMYLHPTDTHFVDTIVRLLSAH
jgi:hypothetical protein